MIHVGQQSAFPKIQFIKNRLNIENAIMRGLQQCSTTGRSLSPILSRRLPYADNEDILAERLDETFPERHDASYKGDSTEETASQSTSSRPQTPTSNPRRGSLMEEMRRQSAVFFDDDIFGNEGTVIT